VIHRCCHDSVALGRRRLVLAQVARGERLGLEVVVPLSSLTGKDGQQAGFTFLPDDPSGVAVGDTRYSFSSTRCPSWLHLQCSATVRKHTHTHVRVRTCPATET